MFNILKRFFMFLLPIIKDAGVQAAVNALDEFAAPKRRPLARYSRPRTSYSQPPRSYTDTVAKTKMSQINDEMPDQFHDVLMVAFDISGPNLALVKAFLANYMPLTGAQTFQGMPVNLDSWWIADDTAGTSDCDSAVFVPKGKQAEARALLREKGIVE